MNVTCADYRLERRLLGLKKKLEQEPLDAKERNEINKEIEVLERALGMD
jgi:hypothetical protein